MQGGLGALTPTEMTIALSGKAYRLGFGMGDSAFAFNGETTPQDLETQLQIFAAYIKDPGFRAAGFEQFKQQLISRIRPRDATPHGTMGLNSSAILHGGDTRWAVPSADDVRAATVEDLKSLLAPLLAQGPDRSGDDRRHNGGRGQARGCGRPWARCRNGRCSFTKCTADNDIEFPPGEALPVILKTSAPANQSIASVAWATHGFYADPRTMRRLSLLSAILRERLTGRCAGAGPELCRVGIAAASTGFDYRLFFGQRHHAAGQGAGFSMMRWTRHHRRLSRRAISAPMSSRAAARRPWRSSAGPSRPMNIGRRCWPPAGTKRPNSSAPAIIQQASGKCNAGRRDGGGAQISGACPHAARYRRGVAASLQLRRRMRRIILAG